MNSVLHTDHPIQADASSHFAAPPPASTYSPARPVVVSRAPDLRIMRFFNPVIRAVLRSPFHGLLGGQILLLTYTGRRSGRRYTLPVGYLRDGDALLVVSQHSELKQWWRNLRGGAPLAVLLRGHTVSGRADVIQEPAAVAAEVERLITRLGAKEASRQLYMAFDVAAPPTQAQLAQVLKGVVVVRITPETTGGSTTGTHPEARHDILRQTLLACGVASSALYVVVTSIPYAGYNPIAQNVSELLAEGAPTRPAMVLVLIAVYNALVVAFAGGVAMSPGRTRTLRFTAAMLVLFAILGAVTGGVFQMHVRGNEPTPRQSLHPIMTLVMSIPIVLSMVAGAFLHGRRFGLYSLATILVAAVFGQLTTQDVPTLMANEPTPWMGLKERVNIYAYLLWIAALALSLWPRRAPEVAREPMAPGRRNKETEYVEQSTH